MKIFGYKKPGFTHPCPSLKGGEKILSPKICGILLISGFRDGAHAQPRLPSTSRNF